MALLAIVGIFPVDDEIGGALTLLRWPTKLLLAGLGWRWLLRIGPSRRYASWPSILLGSAVTALLWIGGSVIFLERAQF